MWCHFMSSRVISCCACQLISFAVVTSTFVLSNPSSSQVVLWDHFMWFHVTSCHSQIVVLSYVTSHTPLISHAIVYQFEVIALRDVASPQLMSCKSSHQVTWCEPTLSQFIWSDHIIAPRAISCHYILISPHFTSFSRPFMLIQIVMTLRWSHVIPRHLRLWNRPFTPGILMSFR